METVLKGIRFPKPVFMLLESYARDNFGLTFADYIIHLAVRKSSELIERDLADHEEFVTAYYKMINEKHQSNAEKSPSPSKPQNKSNPDKDYLFGMLD